MPERWNIQAAYYKYYKGIEIALSCQVFMKRSSTHTLQNQLPSRFWFMYRVIAIFIFIWWIDHLLYSPLIYWWGSSWTCWPSKESLLPSLVLPLRLRNLLIIMTWLTINFVILSKFILKQIILIHLETAK